MTQIGIERKFSPIFRFSTLIGGFFLGILFIIICFPTIIILKVWSNLSFYLNKIQHGQSVSRIHKVDKTHCTKINKSYSYINAPCRFKGNLDIDFIKNKVRRMTYECPDENQRKRLRRIIQVMETSLGYGYFRDDENFDLNNHIREVKKKDVFGNDYDQIEVMKMEWESLVSKMLEVYGTKSVDAGPQWEMIFYKETDQRFTAILRFHHNITDGVNYLRFMMEILADNDNAVGKMPYKYKRPNIFIRVLMGLVNLCIVPFAVFDMALIGRTTKDNSLHGPTLSGDKNFLISKPIPLKIVKEIKKKADTNLNTVFLSTYSHAINQIFRRRNEKVKNCWMLFPLPKNNTDDPVRLINRFKYGFINIPLGKPCQFPREDVDSKDHFVTVTKPCLERLYNLKKYMGYYRRDFFASAVIYIMETVYATFPLFLLRKVISGKGFLSIYSSVAASAEEVELFNSKLEELAFVGFDQNPNGIFLSIIGYKDSIRVGLMVDKALISSQQQAQELLDDFTAEIYGLHYALNICTI